MADTCDKAKAIGLHLLETTMKYGTLRPSWLSLKVSSHCGVSDRFQEGEVKRDTEKDYWGVRSSLEDSLMP